MKRLLLFTLCFLLGVLPSLACALAPEEINLEADELFRKSHTIGGALVLTRGDQIIYQRYYGNQDEENLIPVTPDTYFRIASVTKMISGIGLMQLKEQGLVDLDQDISAYFGYAIANSYYPDTPITLRQLMSHTSTLNTNGGYADLSAIHDMLFKDLRRRGNFTDYIPGSVYAYSNFGAGVVGAVMEAVTGMSVNRYMTEHVFAPLQLDASYSPAMLEDPASVPSLYLRDGTRYRGAQFLLSELYEDYADPENHYRTTVGGLWIRARDLAVLTMALCGDGSVNGVRLLTPESLSQMRDDQASYAASVTGESPYGLFVQREDTLIAGRTVFGHQGFFAGVLCSVYFEPETQFGFVLLTNGCNNVLQGGVGVLARRMYEFAYKTFVSGEEYKPFLVR